MDMVPIQSLPRGVVHLVEDDEQTREATARFLRAAGHIVQTYGNGSEFLASPHSEGCVLLDLQLPGTSGLQVQQKLASEEEPPPVVFLSAQADVPDSVQAMKSGAVDFLTKTEDGGVLLNAISRALACHNEQHARVARQRELRTRYSRLSPREREVFAHLISGQLNKQVGFDLGISVQTAKIHRRRVLVKMRADSIVHLARMATDLGVTPVGSVR
jgi:FixJ family two-component response regulator